MPELDAERYGRMIYYLEQIEKWVNVKPVGLLDTPAKVDFRLEQIRRCVDNAKLTPEQDNTSFVGYERRDRREADALWDRVVQPQIDAAKDANVVEPLDEEFWLGNHMTTLERKLIDLLTLGHSIVSEDEHADEHADWIEEVNRVIDTAKGDHKP